MTKDLPTNFMRSSSGSRRSRESFFIMSEWKRYRVGRSYCIKCKVIHMFQSKKEYDFTMQTKKRWLPQKVQIPLLHILSIFRFLDGKFGFCFPPHPHFCEQDKSSYFTHTSTIFWKKSLLMVIWSSLIFNLFIPTFQVSWCFSYIITDYLNKIQL